MLKAFFVAALLAPLAAQANAQITAPATIVPEKVISAVTGDWNHDGSMDRAVLVEGDDSDAALFVYVADGNGNMILAGYARSIAFAGRMFGNVPDLRLSKSGALQVHSENIAIGRNHWERTLTLAYRNDAMVVGGLTTSGYDTMDPKSAASCDINLLTGKGKSWKDVIKVKAGGVPVADWTDDNVPVDCQ